MNDSNIQMRTRDETAAIQRKNTMHIIASAIRIHFNTSVLDSNDALEILFGIAREIYDYNLMNFPQNREIIMIDMNKRSERLFEDVFGER